MPSPFADAMLSRVTVARTRGDDAGRQYTGRLIRPLAIGGHMVVRTDDGRKLESSRVRRLLVDDPDGRTVYVETRNSAYRIRFEEAYEAEAVRVRLGDTGVEITAVVDEHAARDATDAVR